MSNTYVKVFNNLWWGWLIKILPFFVSSGSLNSIIDTTSDFNNILVNVEMNIKINILSKNFPKCIYVY